MNTLVRYIRPITFSLSGLVTIGVYLGVQIFIPTGPLQLIRLTQFYALLALLYLYLALLASPLYAVFPQLPSRALHIKARRAIGVSAFGFALIHASLAFFGQLGGFAGLSFLSSKYLLAISLSFTALVILGLMAATSFNKAIAFLTHRRWKMLHRFVYLAGILILIHALMLGTHFEDITSFIPQLVFAALAFLFILEGIRIDTYLRSRFELSPRFNLGLIVMSSISMTGLLYFYLPIPGEKGLTFGIHSQHIQLARQAQQGVTGNTNSVGGGNLPKIPGLQGDRTRRFTVSFNNPPNVQPNQVTELSFQVYDASSGNKIRLFNKIYSKIVHLIIVDSELKYFTHIHPEQRENEFTITTQFPKEGRYHLYIDFQPFGGIEQQMAFNLDVGAVDKPAVSTAKADTQLTKAFGDYEVTLNYPKPLKASKLSVGEQTLSYTIKDAKSKKPITTLKPYLAAFGHVVMINSKTFDYLHVHPTDLRPPQPNQNGGPKVEFMPLGLYGPIKPGIYRVFAQFNPDDKLFTSDFTVKIE